jgi:hypothetical protein
MKRLFILLFLVLALPVFAETWTAQAAGNITEIAFNGSVSGAGTYLDFSAGDTISAGAGGNVVAINDISGGTLANIAYTWTATQGAYFTYALTGTNDRSNWAVVGGGVGTFRCSHASGTLTLGNVLGGTAANAYGVLISGAGNLIVIGTVAGNSGTSSSGISITSTGTVTVIGDVDAGGSTYAYGIYSGSTGIVNITGNVTGGSGVDAQGVHVLTASTLNVVGNVTGGSQTGARGIQVQAAGVVNIVGDVTGGSILTATGIRAETKTSTITIDGNLYYNTNTNIIPITGYNRFKFSPNSRFIILDSNSTVLILKHSSIRSRYN